MGNEMADTKKPDIHRTYGRKAAMLRIASNRLFRCGNHVGIRSHVPG
jgi:hypothetical protein